MEYTKLGRTGLDVSRICLGCMSYGGGNRGNHAWSLGEEESRPFIKRALEAGINFFDTANRYSLSSSEKILGHAIKDFARRNEMSSLPRSMAGCGRDPMAPACRAKRSWPKSMRACGASALITSISTRSIAGTTTRRSRRRSKRCTTSSRPARPVISARRRCMPGNSPAPWGSPSGTAGPALSACRTWSTCSTARRSARCCRSAPPRGSASFHGAHKPAGKLTRDWNYTSIRTETDEAFGRLFAKTEDADHKVVDRVAQVAAARGIPRAQVALAWLLAKPVITAPIVGATKLEQLDDAVASMNVKLSVDEIATLEEPYVPHAVVGFD